jgi:hypothetical protein
VNGGQVPQSIDSAVRGVQRASKRLENATKEWEEAYRLYVEALNALNQKTNLKKLA